ncbi:hypothetical protein GCM10008910_20740 [Faecalicatena orotica]|uniref:Uncharacterized protein n=1 Tax=Faecalicatena orotica TaxID=1544 RepID=A0A2Y9B9M2_9FIRM|nr:hypothetical protein [Faecalicatena orotica]PWJ32301.1 hypothetical protein A8806_101589 [Faecalicatena orotica]SSA54135.1 hypothetical protein SAMN05216536_101589 [Faecalicatena orotica]
MANTVVTPYKYSTRTAVDGATLEPGQVMVPCWLQDGYKLNAEEKKRCTFIRYGKFKFHIGFIPIRIEGYETYMAGFNKEINDYMKERREGRCIIGYKANGEPICCPKSKRCKGCESRYDQRIKRYNLFKDRFDILSLDYCYEDEEFDVADENVESPETIACASEDLTEEELNTLVLAHFEQENPRYATIIKLSKQNLPIEEICEAIKLKPSRGREEINNAYNALCDYLNLGTYKIKKKSR